MQPEMEQYLSGPNVPQFLKLPKGYPNYKKANISKETDTANDCKDAKYKQYFNNLNVDGFLFDDHQDSSTSRYYQKHNIYKVELDSTADRSKLLQEQQQQKQQLKDNIQRDKDTDKKQQKSKFGDFVNHPSIFSGFPMPELAYHTTVAMGDKAYIYGGLSSYQYDEYYQLLKNLTNDFQIPAENVTVKLDYNLPLPLSRSKLMSMATKPNNELYKYSSETGTLLKVMDIFPTVDNPPEGDKKSVTSSTRVKYVHPKVLLSSGMAQLSEKHVLLYGGLELTTEIKRFEDRVEVEKKIFVNNQAWVFDTRNCTFKEITISSHPTFSILFPAAIPRFGHAMQSITIEDNNFDADEGGSSHSVVGHIKTASAGVDPILSSSGSSGAGSTGNTPTQQQTRTTSHHKSMSKPALVFIMGGYKADENNTSFLALNDIWKCELVLNKSSNISRFEFADEVVCYPMGNFDLLFDKYSYRLNTKGEEVEDNLKSINFTGIFKHGTTQNWPKPRGFFSMSLVNNSDLPAQYRITLEEQSSASEHGSASLICPTPDVPSHPLRKLSPQYRSSTPPPQRPTPQSATSSLQYPQPLQRTGSPLSGNQPSSAIRQYISLLSTSSDHSSSQSHSTSREQHYSHNNTPGSSSNQKPRTTPQPQSSLSSNSPNSQTARSSPAMPNSHSFQSKALLQKSLVIFGGSTTLYSKVLSDTDDESEETAMGYHRMEILGDMWWFNFQTETWFRAQNFQNGNKVDFQICGHSAISDGSHLLIFPGVKSEIIPEKLLGFSSESDTVQYPITDCADHMVAASLESEQTTERRRTDLAVLHKYYSQLIDPSVASELRSPTNIPDNRFKCYSLDLKTQQWTWSELNYLSPIKQDTDILICGAVTQMVKFDSRLIIIGGDLKMIDKKTGKAGDYQLLFGRGVGEVYTSLLKL